MLVLEQWLVLQAALGWVMWQSRGVACPKEGSALHVLPSIVAAIRACNTPMQCSIRGLPAASSSTCQHSTRPMWDSLRQQGRPDQGADASGLRSTGPRLRGS